MSEGSFQDIGLALLIDKDQWCNPVPDRLLIGVIDS